LAKEAGNSIKEDRLILLYTPDRNTISFYPVLSEIKAFKCRISLRKGRYLK